MGTKQRRAHSIIPLSLTPLSLTRKGLERLREAVADALLKGKPIKEPHVEHIFDLLEILIAERTPGRPEKPDAFEIGYAAQVALALFKRYPVTLADAVRSVSRDDKDFQRIYSATKKLKREGFVPPPPYKRGRRRIPTLPHSPDLFDEMVAIAFARIPPSKLGK